MSSWHTDYKSIRLPVPLVMQLDDGDCLAACAKMVLSYIGHSASRRRLLRLLNVRKQGSYFPNLEQLARLGVSVTIRRGDLPQLYHALSNNIPAIVPVQTAELPYWNGVASQHAVVVGMEQGYLRINDPTVAIPAMRVPIGDFDLAWLEQGEQYAVLISKS